MRVLLPRKDPVFGESRAPEESLPEGGGISEPPSVGENHSYNYQGGSLAEVFGIEVQGGLHILNTSDCGRELLFGGPCKFCQPKNCVAERIL